MAATSKHKFQIVIQLLFHFSCKDIARWVTAALSLILFAYTPNIWVYQYLRSGWSAGRLHRLHPVVDPKPPFLMCLDVRTGGGGGGCGTRGAQSRWWRPSTMCVVIVAATLYQPATVKYIPTQTPTPREQLEKAAGKTLRG